MGDKEWDEMFATLSKQDQDAWEELKSKQPRDCKGADKILDKRGSPTPKEENRLMAFVLEEWAKCIANDLANSKMSPAGQRKVTDLMKKSFTSQR